jgi:hypothetical protein
MPHPPYSQDAAPTESYFFGAVKQLPHICEGRPFKEIQENVREILSSVGPDELDATMRAWMERLRRAIALGGERA